MRLSSLTISRQAKGRTILLNCANGCVDLLRAPLVGPDGHLRADRPPEVTAALARRGHLTALDHRQEMTLLRDYARLLVLQNRWLQRQSGYVMLLLSYACNFACDYCYQKDIRHAVGGRRFGPAEIDLFFDDHAPALCPDAPPENICYVLYGGEPLTPANRPAVERTLFRASRAGSTVEAVTNGYRLEACLDLLGRGPGRIAKLQVSFDCDQSLHDRRRVTLSGGPTFATVLENVVRAAQTGVAIQVRAHMHQGRADALHSFLATLEARGLLAADNVTVYLSPIKHDFADQRDEPLVESCLSARELAALAPLANSAVTRRQRLLARLLAATTGPGPANTAFCMRCKENCYVVDPLGGIYACYEEAGRPELRIGARRGRAVEFFPRRRQTLDENIIAPDPAEMDPLALITGGQCAMTSRRIAAQGLADPRPEADRELVGQALELAIDDHLAQQGPEPATTHLAINYADDGDRSLPSLIGRLAPFGQRLERALSAGRH